MLILIILLFFFLFLKFPPPTHAQVLISEVQPNPTSGPEWVELYNTSSTSATLAGYTISDQLASPSLLHTFSTDTTIEPGQYFQIEFSVQKLNNSGDGVTLQTADGTIIDQMQFESSEPGKTWSRKSWDNNIFLPTQPTPGFANQIPTPTPTTTPTQTPTPSPTPTTLPLQNTQPNQTHYLELSAILPCPNKSEPEQIEVFNPFTYPVQLNNWYIQDEQNNRSTLEQISIDPGEHQTLSLNKNILNNSGDTAYLYDSNHELISFISYQSCEIGQIIFAQNQSDANNNQNQKNATTSATLTSTAKNPTAPNATNNPDQTTNSKSPTKPRPPTETTQLRLTDPLPTPRPKATYFHIPPVPPKKYVFSGILGGMLVAGGGICLLPTSKIKQILNI